MSVGMLRAVQDLSEPFFIPQAHNSGLMSFYTSKVALQNSLLSPAPELPLLSVGFDASEPSISSLSFPVHKRIPDLVE